MFRLNENCPAPWRPLLADLFLGNVGNDLEQFLANELASSTSIYPPLDRVFACLDDVAPDDVRVVLLGQDPYHQPGQATGRAFEVPAGFRLPPSLRNVMKLMARDLDTSDVPSGSLAHWPSQGVLLLNTLLTVKKGEPRSHRGVGWETVTDRIIEVVAATGRRSVFLLWGEHAQSKAALVTGEHNLILTAPHPSPLSAHRGFFECRHFSQTNDWLTSHGELPIMWLANDVTTPSLSI